MTYWTYYAGHGQYFAFAIGSSTNIDVRMVGAPALSGTVKLSATRVSETAFNRSWAKPSTSCTSSWYGKLPLVYRLRNEGTAASATNLRSGCPSRSTAAARICSDRRAWRHSAIISLTSWVFVKTAPCISSLSARTRTFIYQDIFSAWFCQC